VTLQRPVEVDWIPVPRRQKRLPEVLSGTEVAALLSAHQD
jgi:site-specific recombinase XerD